MSKVVKINKAKTMPTPASTSVAVGVYPFPSGTILAQTLGAFLARPMPYALEVEAWEKVYARDAEISKMDAEIRDQSETLERLRRMMGGKLPTDGTYDLSFIAGGDLNREINEGLQAVATDIHRRPDIDEARKLAITIKAEPSENSAAVKWAYEVRPTLAKAEGGGVAYIDKDGKLVPPESVTANQIMLPLSQTGGQTRATA